MYTFVCVLMRKESDFTERQTTVKHVYELNEKLLLFEMLKLHLFQFWRQLGLFCGRYPKEYGYEVHYSLVVNRRLSVTGYVLYQFKILLNFESLWEKY